jgi:hypothetical protein
VSPHQTSNNLLFRTFSNLLTSSLALAALARKASTSVGVWCKEPMCCLDATTPLLILLGTATKAAQVLLEKVMRIMTAAAKTVVGEVNAAGCLMIDGVCDRACDEVLCDR